MGARTGTRKSSWPLPNTSNTIEVEMVWNSYGKKTGSFIIPIELHSDIYVVEVKKEKRFVEAKRSNNVNMVYVWGPRWTFSYYFIIHIQFHSLIQSLKIRAATAKKINVIQKNSIDHARLHPISPSPHHCLLIKLPPNNFHTSFTGFPLHPFLLSAFFPSKMSEFRSKFLEVYSILKSELLHDPAFDFTDDSRQWVERVPFIFLFDCPQLRSLFVSWWFFVFWGGIELFKSLGYVMRFLFSVWFACLISLYADVVSDGWIGWMIWWFS